jgi:RNA polymerase sigma-70 factor (ECF subfamily)
MPIPAGSSTCTSARDTDEFAAFYREHGPRLQRYCVMRFGRSHAEEISQLTMERALQSFSVLDRVRDPWPWLRVVARNTGLNLQRHEHRCSPVDDMGELAGPADRWSDPVDAAERAEKRVLIHTALGRLSDGQQRVLILRLQDELPLDAIAELLGTTENAVRQQLFKARRSFARAYAALGGSGLAVTAGAALGRAYRLLGRTRGARHQLTASAGVTMVLSALSLGLVLHLPADLSHDHGTGTQLDMRAQTTDAPAPVRAVARAGTTSRVVRTRPAGPASGLRAAVSKHPLAPGEVASLTVTVTTPVGTVYYRDQTVNGEAGPVCSAQRSLCS